MSLAGGGGALEPHALIAFADTEGATPAPQLMSLPTPLSERFDSLAFLGEGGMGAVYRARDKRLGRDVALKFLFGSGADTSLRLLREARSQARLKHENACKVYEAGVADGHRYIVMQLIDGELLDKAKKRMTLAEKVRVVRQVAAALHEAHRLGLVHRDSEDATPLRREAPEVPEDIEAIVMKSLEKEPGRRYDSAKALAHFRVARYLVDGGRSSEAPVRATLEACAAAKARGPSTSA